MKSIYKSIVYLMVTLISLTSCKKLIDVPAPITSLNGKNIYASDETAVTVLSGLYTKISAAEMASGNLTSLSFYPGLSSDEFTLDAYGSSRQTYVHYYSNDLNSKTIAVAGGNFWTNIYGLVFDINSAIEGLSASKTLTPSVKNQLLGEAKFLRAFCYFYLVNLYGEVPLALTSDYKVNSTLSRASIATVYDQIKSDLSQAESLLSSQYLDGAVTGVVSDRLRPTKWAAEAFLARVYLFTKDYKNAESESSLLINNQTFELVNLNDVFLTTSKEAIWQLQPVGANQSTNEGQFFIIPVTGPTYQPVILSTDLLNSFESGDNRKTSWTSTISAGGITYTFPYKYKNAAYGLPLTEYSTVLRLAEQYLIRAEANLALGDNIAAINDLNSIRLRAGLPEYNGPIDAQSVLAAVLQERRIEFFSEWGHRWFDLKRSGFIDNVMNEITPLKGGVWQTTDQLYPISSQELQLNHNLIQNPGY